MPPPLSVGLATQKSLPKLDDDEAPLVAALAARDIRGAPVVWNDAEEKWLNHPLTVLRNTWDYVDNVEAFTAWCGRVDSARTLLNKPSVVRWNSHKSYLNDLAEEGVTVVPTVIVERMHPRARPRTLASVMDERSWDDVVVKPAVGAGSRRTERITRTSLEVGEALLTEIRAGGDALVQPFLPAIAEGEISLVFLGGALSHVVKKVPMAGEFRCQEAFGGEVTPVTASKKVIELATQTVRATGAELLYARVDVVRGTSGRYEVMELELIEPSLFLRHSDTAAAALADLILAQLLRLREKSKGKAVEGA